jgi:hypothetical protein
MAHLQQQKTGTSTSSSSSSSFSSRAKTMRYADFIYGDAPELRPLLDHCAAFLSAARANASGSNGSRSTGNHSRGSNSTTTTTHASGGRGSGGRVRVEHVDGGGVLGTVSGTKLEAATLTFRHGQADFGRI